MGFEVLSLPSFFAPAKKEGRQPGRIPGGLSRSEKNTKRQAQHKAHAQRQTAPSAAAEH
jgi:hypothetical protein